MKVTFLQVFIKQKNFARKTKFGVQLSRKGKNDEKVLYNYGQN